jgi:superfamily I DNA and RNA helicase
LDKRLTEEYDCILMDEAQDAPVEFYRVLYKIAKPPKRIVWAYDELQTVGDTSIPEPGELFGKTKDSTPAIALEAKKDFILKKSYRNHFDVLFTAVALGFGFYSPNGIVQIISKTQTWEALGFSVRKGSMRNGEDTEIERPRENNPNMIDTAFSKFPILRVSSHDSRSAELQDVARSIAALVKEEHVRPQDIMVIDMNTRKAKEDLEHIQRDLFTAEINSTMPGLIDGSDDFLIEENVTLTTARRAKGNEVPVVFVISIDALYARSTLIQERINRNMCFVALTRSKGWCFISGSGAGMQSFQKEIQDIQRDKPVLKFPYPSKERESVIQKLNYFTADDADLRELKESEKLIERLLKSDPEMTKLILDEETKLQLRKYIDKL